MEEHRLPDKAYKMLLHLDDKGKVNWVSNIRDFLCRHGFAFVWLNQGVGSINVFLKAVHQRLVDCRWQTWHDHIQNSERFSFYRNFKTTVSCEPYLALDVDRHLKCCMAKFRFGVSDIFVHTNRFQSTGPQMSLCPFCENELEDETHFVLSCPAYNDLRKDLISPKYYNNPCRFRLFILLCRKDHVTLKNVCIFLYKASQRRNLIVS